MNMDFQSSLPILVGAGSGIAICCTGLSIYLMFLKASRKEEKQETRDKSKL